MSTESPENPVAVNGIKRKREELMKLRREHYEKIKAIDRDIALLGNALRLFEPDNYVSKAVAERKSKNRSNHTRRMVFDVLRESGKPMSARQIADVIRSKLGVEDTPAERRVWGTRVSAALQNAKVSCLTEVDHAEDGTIMWTLVGLN